ncbi:MAG: FtsW/RodA/SpoVE family cell cycle protein [Lawsonibacter sp.]|jgi:rod shape determining protein RodA|uniref:FtsW/RodA/SpoVE family cell cycle protein n=1 Tax=Lawsonibacter sp. JLR.KK007 TaxID=3114293 RepID=UPI00216D2BBC|nr:FtsW/RodA/SpoVE family cell cycle protein [Lawsonibacter sp.]MCI8990640.1 FtsW/RodA/SpoVE family cell cycle protein [Lawsonibacter sp.]MCI9267537.1 FtsW/RodA/SpoVE family cell cycle protein [Lawsonibacter sp.]
MSFLSLLFSPIKEFWKKGDIILLGLCLAASTFGLALIFSATQYQNAPGQLLNRSVIVQAIAIGLGVIAYVLLTFVDFQLFTEKRWKLMLLGSIFLLLMILTPWGVERYGNRNWIQIPHFPMMIQPNEIVKIPFILILALLIITIQDRGYSISSIPSVMQIGGFTVFTLGLIAAICGDMGTCCVYIMIFAFMAWTAGVKLRWFVLVGGGAVLAAVIFWLFFLPETRFWTDYRIMRFRVVFDHDLDPSNYGFQQTRAILAIGSGKLFGQGYLKGIQTHASNSSALPVRDSDLIFAVCGEELGMVGCMALLLLLSAIVLRCIWVGRHASSPFSAYVCMGMAGMLLSQITFNVGMCLYVLPVMGLTLPFVSSGGSSIITLFAAMGLVSSVKARPMPSWLRDRSKV